MRLKVKTGINNCSLIDDSYSSDFQSLKIALILESQKQSQKRRLFFRIYFKLSNEELYSKVSQLIISNNSRVIGIGETIRIQR
jgi:alanine racemase